MTSTPATPASAAWNLGPGKDFDVQVVFGMIFILEILSLLLLLLLLLLLFTYIYIYIYICMCLFIFDFEV